MLFLFKLTKSEFVPNQAYLDIWSICAFKLMYVKYIKICRTT